LLNTHENLLDFYKNFVTVTNMNTAAITNSPHYPALVKFIEGVNAKMAKGWAEAGLTYNTPPTCAVASVGKRYAKLVHMEQSPWKTGPRKAASVYCFFDFTNGDLLKGTWKAPVANGVRGNLSDPNVLDKFTQHGPAYLRG
jgi:hypothetical protein